MRIEFNTAEHKKVMVEALSELMGAEAVYMKVPTCAYKIDYFTVTKDGALEFEEPLTDQQIGQLLEFLASRGFTAKNMPVETKETENEEAATEEATESAEDAEDELPTLEDTGLTLALPIEMVNTENLQRLLDGKGSLIKKALGVDALPIKVSGDKVSFPWFSVLPSPEETQAYTEFISALCRKSKERSRITVKDHPVENEKYAFRCFLLGLGFIGDEFKEARKTLLKNLSGSAAFKSGSKKGGEEA